MALADLLPVSLVEIGKIKIGGKGAARQSKSGGTYRQPEKYDHFVITTLFRDDKTENFVIDTPLMDALKDHTDKDGKLRSIPILFGSNNLDEVMQTSYTWYIGKTCGARTDGQTITFWSDPKTGNRLPEPKEYKWHPDYLELPDPTSRTPKKLLKRFSTLNCMIASPAARFGGFYRFRTTSEISSRQLYGSLMHFAGPRGLCPGTLRGLPFRLVVRPMPVAPEGKPTIVHVVHVEYMHSDLKALQSAAQEQRKLELEGIQMVVQAEQQYKMLLAAQQDDEPDEDLVDDSELPMLPMPGKEPSREEKEYAAIDEIEKALKGAADLAAVQAFWSSDRFKNHLWPILDDAQHNAIVVLKDQRKVELAKPAEKPVESTEEPAEPESAEDTPLEPPAEPAEPESAEDTPLEPPADEPPAPQTKTTKAGKAIQNQIDKLIAEVGTTWADVRAEHGIAESRVADLPSDLALALVKELKLKKEPVGT
jgi:hypothetical protein